MQYTGTVEKSTGNFYRVRTDKGFFNCKIRGKFRLKGIKTTNPCSVGDVVDFNVDEKEDIGIIYKVYPRKNYIIRKSVNLSKQAHIIAANIDLAILIAGLKSPKTHTEFIDRFLVSCEAYDIPAAIIFNKSDLFGETEKELSEELSSIYQNIGYKTLTVSVTKKINTDKIKDLISGKTVVITGNSGVGKSALINLLDPNLSLKIGNISEYYEQGVHTTTYAEMFPLNDGFIIDTPGIRSFGLFDMDKRNISHYFPEIFRISENCKYNNCIHIEEPGCAVLEAVQKREISLSRYKSYFNIITDEDSEKYRKDIYKI